MEAIFEHPRLEALALTVCGFDIATVFMAFDLRLSCLKRLDLSGNEAVKKITRIISVTLALEKFVADDAALNFEGFGSVRQCLLLSRRTLSLGFRNNKLSSDDIEVVFHRLLARARPPKQGYAIGDFFGDGNFIAKFLLQVLAKSNSLRLLSLNRLRIDSDNTQKWRSQFLAGNEYLEELHLAGSPKWPGFMAAFSAPSVRQMVT
jgi:hypothetical protein